MFCVHLNQIFYPFKILVQYTASCKNCNYVYIGESGHTGNIRISEHRCDYKKGEQKSKLVIHSLKTYHIPDFNNCKIIKYNCNNYHSRTFLKQCIKSSWWIRGSLVACDPIFSFIYIFVAYCESLNTDEGFHKETWNVCFFNSFNCFLNYMFVLFCD